MLMPVSSMLEHPVTADTDMVRPLWHCTACLSMDPSTLMVSLSLMHKKCTVILQAVNEFQSLVSQVQKSSSMVEKVVYSIMTSSLVKDPAVQGHQDVMDLQELYDHLERFRLEVRDLQGLLGLTHSQLTCVTMIKMWVNRCSF